MVYKRFSVRVVVRLLLLLLNMMALAVIVVQTNWRFSLLILAMLMVFQVYELFRFINKTNHDLARFLYAIRNSDYSINFSGQQLGSSFEELYGSFREITDAYRMAKIEKEAQYQYVKAMVEHLNVGIISVNRKDEIVLMNPAAEEILNRPNPGTWTRLAAKSPEFTRVVDDIKTGGQKLVEIALDRESRYLNIYVTTIRLPEDQYTLYTFQNIRSEIELKEIEAWHKLIRILTHEIMNSVTPIASLTETLVGMLENESGSVRSAEALPEDWVEDLHMALKTIDRRSNGLLHFVNDYRKLSKVPHPKPEKVRVVDLLERVHTLMQPEANRKGIALEVAPVVRSLEIVADPRLIEQVLINLVINSLEALENTTHPSIQLRCYIESNRRVLEVADNGPGIAPEMLDKIFVPFFSTKEQGSGIGLSLSKHILKLHGGSLRTASTPGQQTSFYLEF
ncbi:MAG: PAS domain-containing sensor histidine kinase [Salibacteraceae bacterium]